MLRTRLEPGTLKRKEPHGEDPEILRMLIPASILQNNRVVFNIKGNSYRLVVAVKYDFQIVYIRFIGTHGAYDKVDAEEI